MHVVILGAGVVGVTTAYYLARAGHRVTVLDRQPGVGLETSFANAGMVTVGYAAPWSGPGLPWKSVKWMFSGDSPLKFKPRLDPAMVAWMWQWWLNCSLARYTENKSRMVRLSAYSLQCLQVLRDATGIHYDERARGTLQLFRTDAQLAAAEADIAIIRQLGVACELLDARACLAVEPGLAGSSARVVGGLRLPADETGDCLQFTELIADRAMQLGVEFRFDISIEKLLHERDRIVAVQTDRERIEGDCFVMALGSHSVGLLRPLGIRIPVYPLKGYALTIPIIDASRAPQSTMLDETSKVAITRMGNRIRAGGIAEITGYDTSLPLARKRSIGRVVETLFPGAGDIDSAEFWTGLRAVTPDGPPVLGATQYRNFYLNTGHGSFGWTMACGAASILADLISGKQPEIALDGLTLDRYRK